MYALSEVKPDRKRNGIKKMGEKSMKGKRKVEEGQMKSNEAISIAKMPNLSIVFI